MNLIDAAAMDRFAEEAAREHDAVCSALTDAIALHQALHGDISDLPCADVFGDDGCSTDRMSYGFLRGAYPNA